MSTVAEEQTPAARRHVPRGRVGAVVGVLLLAAAAYGLSAAHVVGGSNTAPSGSGSTTAAVSSGGGGGAGAGGGGPTGSASPSGSGQAGAAGGAGAGAHATPSPTPQATFDSSKTLIAGEGNWRQSDCEGGFEPGETCAVSYQGEYYLAGTTSETVLMTATAKDGRVLAQASYPAPTGGHRFGGLLKFTVPKDVTVIDMMAVLQDAQGHVIAKTSVQQSYAA
jgi:hypothetical protein